MLYLIHSTHMTQTTVRVNLKLARGSHRTFKVWCAQNGLTLQEGLERAIAMMVRGTPSPVPPGASAKGAQIGAVPSPIVAPEAPPVDLAAEVMRLMSR
jgi:hypothetical protein